MGLNTNDESSLRLADNVLPETRGITTKAFQTIFLTLIVAGTGLLGFALFMVDSTLKAVSEWLAKVVAESRRIS